MDGFAVCRKIRETSRVPIVMLTARGDVMDRIVGLELGADDYLPKPFEPRELVARIQAVLRRGKPSEEDEVLRVGALEVNWTARSARLDGQRARPDHRGVRAPRAARAQPRPRADPRPHPGRDEGLDWESYDRCIDVLVSRLRQKLGDDAKQPAFIRTVRGTGYSFIGGGE